MASTTNAIPLVLGSLLGIMVAVLFLTLLLFYKKRKESIDFKPQIEKMTRGLKEISKNMTSKSKKSGAEKSTKAGSDQQQRIPVILETQFWVPEVYNAIVQPSPTHMRKESRMQLDREIYSKVCDPSYLSASDNREVFDAAKRKLSGGCITHPPRQGEREREVGTDPVNRGILHFSFQYKQDVGILYIVVLRAEGLMQRKGEPCNPFVYIQVSPTYKRHMHSEVHQKTQHPVFNQTFEFELSPYDVREQTVTFTILDFNQEYIQWNHESIGSVVYKLDTLGREAFFAGKEFVLWNKLEKDKSDCGASLSKVDRVKFGRN